jgi:hypothetical protein
MLSLQAVFGALVLFVVESHVDAARVTAKRKAAPGFRMRPTRIVDIDPTRHHHASARFDNDADQAFFRRARGEPA